MKNLVSVSCMLLCAGESKRMFPAHKLFLPLGEAAMVTGVLNEILKAGFDEVIVITGFKDQELQHELRTFPVKFIHNKNFSKGMHSSIKVGFEHSLNHGFVAVCLSDQPLLRSGDYEKLIAAAQENPGAKLISPTFNGKRGNPVLISLELKSRVLSRPDEDRGCSYLFDYFPNDVISVPMNTDSILKDIDTPEDYQCLISTKP